MKPDRFHLPWTMPRPRAVAAWQAVFLSCAVILAAQEPAPTGSGQPAAQAPPPSAPVAAGSTLPPVSAPPAEAAQASGMVEPLALPLDTAEQLVPATETPSPEGTMPEAAGATADADVPEPLPTLDGLPPTLEADGATPMLPVPESELSKQIPLESVSGPFGLSGSYSGLKASLLLSAIYDSNIYQLSESEIDQFEAAGTSTSDFILSIGPILGYRSPGPLWYIDLDYTPSYVAYVDNDNLSGWDQNGLARLRYDRGDWKVSLEGYYASNRGADQSLASLGQAAAQSGGSGQALDREGISGEDTGIRFSASHNGPRLDTRVSASYASSSGGNRYYGADVTEFTTSLSGVATYTLSPRTSMEFSANYYLRSPDSEDLSTRYDETLQTNAQLSALWKFSPLLRLGPGVRYTYDTRELWDGGRNSLGPILRANYQLSRKLQFDGQIGAEFVSIDARPGVAAAAEEEVDSPFISGSLRATYSASRLWSADLSMNRSVRPDVTQPAAFQEVFTTRLSVNRRIAARSILSVGLGYETTDTNGFSLDYSREYLTLDSTLSFPIWGEHVSGAIFGRYRDEQGDRPGDNWSGFQVGVRAMVTF